MVLDDDRYVMATPNRETEGEGNGDCDRERQMAGLRDEERGTRTRPRPGQSTSPYDDAQIGREGLVSLTGEVDSKMVDCALPWHPRGPIRLRR